MCPFVTADVDEYGDGEELTGRAGAVGPVRANRRKTTRVRTRARRNRATEVARRGMHQRRNKRAAW
jgi:hypothetical protein